MVHMCEAKYMLSASVPVGPGTYGVPPPDMS